MDNANALSISRIVAGAAAWGLPEASLRAGMLDPAAPQSPYLLRLFGARDVALGTITMMAKPEHKPALLKVGLAVDAADGAAAVLALQRAQVKPPAGVLLSVMAASAMVAGAVALREQKR